MRFRRFPLRAACSVVAILVPRGPASYPVYLVANALLVSIGPAARAAHRRLGLFIAWVLLAYFVQVQTGALLSPTAFALELLLLSPLLLFVLDYRPALSSREALWALRIVNLACLVVSVASYIGQGFPVMLPYRDFSPDYYWAAYGWGGARIVTVFGFTGLVLRLSTVNNTLLALYGMPPKLLAYRLVGICSVANRSLCSPEPVSDNSSPCRKNGARRRCVSRRGP